MTPSKVCMYRKITTLPPPPNWYLFPNVLWEDLEFSSNWLGAVCVLQDRTLHQDKSVEAKQFSEGKHGLYQYCHLKTGLLGTLQKVFFSCWLPNTCNSS